MTANHFPLINPQESVRREASQKRHLASHRAQLWVAATTVVLNIGLSMAIYGFTHSLAIMLFCSIVIFPIVFGRTLVAIGNFRDSHPSPMVRQILLSLSEEVRTLREEVTLLKAHGRTDYKVTILPNEQALKTYQIAMRLEISDEENRAALRLDQMKKISATLHE